MGVFRQFPYSNFHEMNMDEIIKIIKNMLEEWATYHAEWDEWMDQMEDDWSNYQDVMNTAWQNMQNFINNYFDNLDVQEEINNKIVSMIQTGEFGLLVNEYIPPAVNAWLNLNITQPTGVVIDTSLSVAGACADAKATGDAINRVQDHLTAITHVEVLDNWDIGFYIPLNNSTTDVHDPITNESWKCTVNTCIEGDVFYISAEGGSGPRAYGFVDDQGNILDVAKAYDVFDTARKVAPPDSAYIVINDSVSNNNISLKGTPAYMLFDQINESIGITGAVTYTEVVGKYINNEGTEGESESFSHSNPIEVHKGDIIKFNARGYGTNVAMIAVSNEAGTIFIPKVISIDSTVRLYTYIVEESGYIIVSYNHAFTHDLTIDLYYSNAALDVRINEVDNKYTTDIVNSYGNITCIGDSLTYSQVYTSDNTAREAYRTYPEILATKTGATVTTLAEPGDSASQCWTRYSNSITAKDGQLTIVYLGTNGGLTDTMETDMVGDDYNEWSNTNTGCYGKIIAKSLSVNSRVVLVKVYDRLTNADITNGVIEDMGTKFDVPVIDNEYLSDLKYHMFPDGSSWNTIHYNDFGYAMFTSQLIHNINNLADESIIKIIPL